MTRAADLSRPPRVTVSGAAALFTIALAMGSARAETPTSPAGSAAAAATAAPAAATATPAAATGAVAATDVDLDLTVESQGRSKKPSEKIELFAALVGGAHAESLKLRDDDDTEDRTTTIALSRFGFRGNLGGGVFVESEFEVNAGPHGTSVWEGQAALQVRNQLVRIERNRVRVDVGRITDDSSLDYFSHHNADQLLTDPYTRAPLLASGFNRGQGILFRYKALPGLEPGITVNAANPTSTTASLVVGGTFPPFSRFYIAPHQQVGRDASSFPADTYHITLVTPSVVYKSDLVDAQTALQMFRINTDTSSTDDENIIGYNIRAGAKLKLLSGMVTPFVNGSRVENSMVDKQDGAVLSPDAYIGYTLTGGVDVNYADQNGVGASYSFVRGTQGSESRAIEHFVNIGTTYWLTGTTSVGARAALYSVCVTTPGVPCEREQARSLFATLRTIL